MTRRRRPRDPPDQRARRRLLPRADASASCATLVEPLERAREVGARDGALDRRLRLPRARASTTSSSRSSQPGRVRDRARPDRLGPRASTSRRPSTTSTSTRSTSSARTRSTRGCASGGTYLCGPLARYTLEPRPALAARARGGARGRARAARAATRSAASSSAASSSSTPATRRCGSSRRTRSRTRRPSQVEPRRRHRLRRAARRRAACSTTATGSTPTARSSTRRSSRRRRRTSSRSRTTCATSSRATPTSDDDELRAPLRADDPQLRPVHLVRDALPRRSRSSGGERRVVDRRRQRVPRRRRRRARRRRAPARRVRRRASRSSPCEQEPSRLIDAWEGAERRVVVDAVASGARARDAAPLRRERGRRSRRASSARSTHAFGVGEAIELARALGRLPRARRRLRRSRARSFAAGEALTPPVEAAVAARVDAVLARRCGGGADARARADDGPDAQDRGGRARRAARRA